MGKSIVRLTWKTTWFLLMMLAVGLCVSATPLQAADDAVCAVVKIEIKQELTLERQAFDAHMRITNGLSHVTLENVNVSVNFTDANGLPVLASSDPDNTEAIFFIREDTMTGIDSVSGSGTVAGDSTADIHWLIIPAPNASNGVPQGTLYYVGATLTYTLGGEPHVTEVSPDYIYVKPMPEIVLDYFLTREVFGDDPFTGEVEPEVPFSLGVRVSNNGSGAIRNLKIDSAQPRIIENDQGLLIGFKIDGSRVNGEPAKPTLLAEFGNVAPDSASVARWIMTCTLSGKFVAFEASFTHADELGGALTSLIQEVNTHDLLRDVRVDLPGRDTVQDFLSKDDDIIRVYESEGQDFEVVDATAAASLSYEGLRANLQIPGTAGFAYVKLADAFNGNREIARAVRSDGKELDLANVWLSKSRPQDQAQNWEHFLNLFDVDTPGIYTLYFRDPTEVPDPPVMMYIPEYAVYEGQILSFVVQASDPDGTVPQLLAAPLPVGAQFSDQADGHGVFRWDTLSGQAGTYEIVFTATDGALQGTRRATLRILSSTDADGDGLPDTWEQDHFGDLIKDGTADTDGDGLSDMDEYRYGTDPNRGNLPPTAPAIAEPVDQSDVDTATPVLTITNSEDPDGDDLTYIFELYADTLLTERITFSEPVDQEAAGTTAWTAGQDLVENQTYFWRVRAFDGQAYSLWTYGRFRINADNQPPGLLRMAYPLDAGTVTVLLPELAVVQALDPDHTSLTYEFALFSDPEMTQPVDSGSVTPAATDALVTWTPSVELTDLTGYHWRVIAWDAQDASSENTAAFTADTTNAPPAAPQIVAPALDEVLTDPTTTLVADLSPDLDSDPLTAQFELDHTPIFNSGQLKAATDVGVTADQAHWALTDLQDNRTYAWRVRASDGRSLSPWTTGRFTVNAANDPPPAPELRNPGRNAWVAPETLMLAVAGAYDPDGDTVRYEFELYADAQLTDLVGDHQSDQPTWSVPEDVELDRNQRYYWRCRAVDQHDLAGPWMATAYFMATGPSTPPDEIEVTVRTDAGRVLNGLRLYAFRESGSYYGRYATTDAEGVGRFTSAEFEAGGYTFRLDYLGQQIWSETLQIPGAYRLTLTVPEETVTVTVADNNGPLGSTRVYLFSASGSYLGQYAQTDANGKVSFDLPEGYGFKFRADYLGSQYWSAVHQPQDNGDNTVSLDTGGGRLRVYLQKDAQTPMAGFRLYLFSAAGSYLGRYGDSDDQGLVDFQVSEGTYKIRADYLGYQFWTADTPVAMDTVIDLEIPHQDVTLTVRGDFQGEATPLAGNPVYLYSAGGSYLNRNALTDEAGQVVFNLPQKAYKVRADYLGQPFWSGDFGWQNTPVIIPEAEAQVAVIGAGTPLEGVGVYLFGSTGTYLNRNQTTDTNGQTTFRLPAGTYDFRADYQSSQFWSGLQDLTADQVSPITIATGGGAFELIVQNGAAHPFANLKAYVFDDQGTYLGLNSQTDAQGRVSFDLSDGTYQIRVDYLAQQFWSDAFSLPAETQTVLTIPEASQTVVATAAGLPAEGVRVHLFGENDQYLGRYETTDTAGEALFDLPVGHLVRFRADLLDHQYWSDTVTIEADPLPVPIDCGGGQLTVSVRRSETEPMPGISVYLFDDNGAYLGQQFSTNSDGHAFFDLPQGIFRIRADYLGYQFWSDDISVAEDLLHILEIPHQDIPVTVAGRFQLADSPFADVPVYLYGPTGSYLGQKEVTDAQGQTVFSLPQREFKMRADYLSQQFWTSPVTWQAVDLVIPEGQAHVAISGAGFPQAGVTVYVFSESGSYLGHNAATDENGGVTFRIPSGTYRYRADYLSDQLWSAAEPLTADMVNPVVISVGGGEFTVNLKTDSDQPLAGLRTYGFDGNDSYVGMYGASDTQGQVFFDLPDGDFRFRADYLGYQFWSDATTIPDIFSRDLVIPHQTVTVTLQQDFPATTPLEGLALYLFKPAGAYLGQKRTSGADGSAQFTVPDQPYLARVDYLGRQYWSAEFTQPDIPVTIVHGGVDLTVVQGGAAVADAKVYLFSDGGAYLSRFEYTNAAGEAQWVLPEGHYKLRVDTPQGQFWLDDLDVQAGVSLPLVLDLDNS